MTENMAALEAFGLAVVLSGRGRTAEAARSYRRALEMSPDFVEAHYNLANLYQSSGLLDLAEPHYRAIPEDHPLAARAHCNYGSLLARRGRLEEATTNFAHALDVDPGLSAARHGLANALLSLGRSEEAAENFRLMMVTQATHVEARAGLGLALQGMGRLEEAATQLRKVAEARPDDATARANLGRVLAQLGQFVEAERHLRKALDLNPEDARRHGDLGFLRQTEGRHGEAVAAYRSATLLAPNDASLHYNLATALLGRGDFSQGWAEFESRLALKNSVLARIGIDQPPWDGVLAGEGAAGRTILVYSEGGTSDLIQFARYLTLLADLGARVVLACPPALIPLLSKIEGVSDVVALDRSWPPFDEHVPLMSLPHIFGTELGSIPAPASYLSAAPALVAKLGARFMSGNGNLRVGIAWQGDSDYPQEPGYPQDKARSIPLNLMTQVSTVLGVTLYSLQKGSGYRGGVNARNVSPLIDFSSELDNEDGFFMNMAAVMTHLDLVISVDAPTAHLAGALARPTWVLLTSSPDWRWLHDRLDSPWYPSVRLFRQPEMGDWNTVMAQVTTAIQQLRGQA